jgi:hypothetical protein
MSEIKFQIKGNFQTDNCLHKYEDPKKSPLPQLDILEVAKEASALLKNFHESGRQVEIRASGLPSMRITLNFGDMSPGGKFNLAAHAKKPALIAEIDGEFTFKVDSGDEKELKKAHKAGKLKFFVTNIGNKQETSNPYSYSYVSGKIAGGEWGSDDSWPAVSGYESDLFDKKADSKKAVQKSKPTVIVPIKVKTKIAIDSTKVDAVKSAVEDGLTMRVALAIKGGSYSFDVKVADLKGKANFSMKGKSLSVDIDANCTTEVDSWMKKYKAQAPFTIELICVLDTNSELHYFGEWNENGYFDSLKIGALDFS